MYIVTCVADIDRLRQHADVPALLITAVEAQMRDIHARCTPLDPLEGFSLEETGPIIILVDGESPGSLAVDPRFAYLPDKPPEWQAPLTFDGAPYWSLGILQGNDRCIHILCPRDCWPADPACLELVAEGGRA